VVKLEQETPENIRAMDEIYQSVMQAIEGRPLGLTISVLLQIAIGQSPTAPKSDAEFLGRLTALLATLSWFECEDEMTDANLAKAVDDIASIATAGPRSVVIPALVHSIVAIKATGRRNFAAEDKCVRSIRAALGLLEQELSSASGH